MNKDKDKTRFLKFVSIVCILFLIAGCFEEREFLWEHEVLEWEPPNRSTNALNMTVNLEANATEHEIVALRLQYAGAQKSEDMTGTFAVDEENSEAVEGVHFEILSGTSVTIAAGSSVSEEIEIEILSGNIENGETLDIVLQITNDGDIPPMENYREFNLFIVKGEGGLPVLEVTLDRPGFLADPDLLDVATGETYSKNAANDNPEIQQQIDFGLWNSSSTELTMIVPTDSDRLGGWGSGRTVRDEWADENKNDGVLIKLPVNPDNRDLFDNIVTEEDIRDAFYEAEEQAADLDLDVDNHGPGGHIQYISTGEIILFKSHDRGIYAIAMVDDAVAGGDGYLDLLIKRVVE